MSAVGAATVGDDIRAEDTAFDAFAGFGFNPDRLDARTTASGAEAGTATGDEMTLSATVLGGSALTAEGAATVVVVVEAEEGETVLSTEVDPIAAAAPIDC